ncbi:unnamed protein product [Paramecium primaurelia]|uniref:Transmembrane protein n=1 Tax=Paramecium primaurelia TaxID=5886 RepID=A0A8S1JMY2_PARPR|nr:unnamed protein product [Paramecium primaurelia]
MEILCCLCECFFGDDDKRGLLGIICCCVCCYQGYKENIAGNRKRTFRYFNAVLLLILSIVAVVLTSIIQSKASLSNQQITKILENWQLGVLIDIKILDSCPSNYELLTFYKIPGTQDGCICLGDKEIDTYDCSDWQLLKGCYNQEAKSPIEFFNWAQPSNNSFKSVQICAMRSQINFYDLLQNKITTEEDCKANGYKVCQTQSSENFQCVLQEEPCPIRDIMITQYQLSEYDLQLNNYSLIYDNGFYVYTSQSKETTPLLKMAIVKGKGVCFDEELLSLNPKLTEDYLLFSPQPEDCLIDNSYYQISKTNERELLTLNNILALVQSERPLYNVSNKIEYQLLAQNQIYFKQKCRIDNFQQLIDLGSKFDTQGTLITCQLVFACFLFCVIFVIILNELHRCFYKDCGKGCQTLIIIIKEISTYLLAITVIVSYSFMIDLVLQLEEFNSKNCLPDNGQERMNLVYKSLSDASLSLSYSLIINIGIMIIVDFAMTTFLCFKIYKSKFGSFRNPIHFNNNYQNDNNYQNQNPYQDPYLKQQYQQNPAPQYYEQEVNHNQISQQYYIQNQVQDIPQIIQEQKVEDNNKDSQNEVRVIQDKEKN